MLIRFLGVVVLLFSTSSIYAFSPTVEQLQFFQNLSSEEKNVLFKKYGKGEYGVHQKPDAYVETIKPLDKRFQVAY
jgi:hypothetical protein